METETFAVTNEGREFNARPPIEIRNYCSGDGVAFRMMNEDWIEKNFGLEEKDRMTLGDPERYILEPGGRIYMAFAEGKPVGCCALLWMEDGVYEVAKMTVVEGCRGQGIGRKLLVHTIRAGWALGAKSLYLVSNDGLVDAVHLYESLGFRHISPERVTPSPYARANVFMELLPSWTA